MVRNAFLIEHEGRLADRIGDRHRARSIIEGGETLGFVFRDQRIDHLVVHRVLLVWSRQRNMNNVIFFNYRAARHIPPPVSASVENPTHGVLPAERRGIQHLPNLCAMNYHDA